VYCLLHVCHVYIKIRIKFSSSVFILFLKVSMIGSSYSELVIHMFETPGIYLIHNLSSVK
jgi:hypothetical protein